MARTQNPIDFGDAKAVRRFARVISVAIIMGAGAFAAVLSSMVPRGAPDATDHELYNTFVIIAVGLVLFATTIGTRMHGFQGTPEERRRKTLVAHVVSLGLSEGAAFLGLVLVLTTRSWSVILPAALGFAGLATSAIRGEVRFSSLVQEADALGE
jgi:hypothetical protein